jgi:integrase
MAESEIHPLSQEEARKFLHVARGTSLTALYALALATGMRQSEMLGLQWPEVDLDAALIRVRWQLKHEEGRWVWKQPKTRRSRRPLAARNIYRAFHSLLEIGSICRVRFHDLRHTAATLLLASRVNPKVVSEMLGHATVAITLDIYSHVLPDMQQDAAATLERVLYG